MEEQKVLEKEEGTIRRIRKGCEEEKQKAVKQRKEVEEEGWRRRR